MLKTASFLTEVPEWTQPPKPPQDGTDLIYYKSIVICLLGLFQETNAMAQIERWRISNQFETNIRWSNFQFAFSGDTYLSPTILVFYTGTRKESSSRITHKNRTRL